MITTAKHASESTQKQFNKQSVKERERDRKRWTDRLTKVEINELLVHN